MLKIIKINSNFEKEWLINIKNVKNNINFIVFCLLVSFLVGNIFGLNSKIFLFDYPGIIFFIFPFLVELINILLLNLIKINKNLCLIFFSFRRGFLLGIFIEAFKVGS